MGSCAEPRPPGAHRWRHGEGTPREVTRGSPVTLPSPQIVSRLGNSPTWPGREQAVPTFFPQVAPAAFLRPFPQGPGRPSRETFAGRNLGGARAGSRPCSCPRASRGGCARLDGLPGARRCVCPCLAHRVSAPFCGTAQRLWVWMFMCVFVKTPRLCASLHQSRRACARACGAGHGLCL